MRHTLKAGGSSGDVEGAAEDRDLSTGWFTGDALGSVGVFVVGADGPGWVVGWGGDDAYLMAAGGEP